MRKVPGDWLASRAIDSVGGKGRYGSSQYQELTPLQRSRARIQALADRVAAWFVPAVLVVAVASFEPLPTGPTTASAVLVAVSADRL